ncbi:DNA-directed RNA polymerase subunit beta [Candidatus Johnevansia muelleri]|uniref:DNA-directed RNA polymerase subunit beta n=1 Tax=Candidatus Johnevansia muelleri TaxID=1495769 RepID=A0A078KHE1_9GAMM|nr:DNA-directed RNA polymerase subunit beta [Candidatus Evansia muelleri]
MIYSNTEKKVIRKHLGKIPQILGVPNLLSIQLDSYRYLLQNDVHHNNRVNIGIHAVLKSFFPITSNSGNTYIEYKNYHINMPIDNLEYYKKQNYTYSASLIVLIRIIVFKKNENSLNLKIKYINEQEVYMGDIPIMTENGTFIINGSERVIISQLHRSPGLYFTHDNGKTHSSGKLLYSARIIPKRGSWLDFEFDIKDNIYFRIDRNRKLPVTVFLYALGFTTEEIMSYFCKKYVIYIDNGKFYIEFDQSNLYGNIAGFAIKNLQNKCIVQKGEIINHNHIYKIENAGIKYIHIQEDFLLNKVLVLNVYDQKTGLLICPSNSIISKNILESLNAANIKYFEILYTNEINAGEYISNTLKIDTSKSQIDALYDIYSILRPGETFKVNVASMLLNNLFFSSKNYDLSLVGRMKLNTRLNRKKNHGPNILTLIDILDIIKELINIRNGYSKIDDIDNLGNRRIRSVGEIVEQYFHNSLICIDRIIKERLLLLEKEKLMPQDIFNSKSIALKIKEFFILSPLSQFIDQNNPLSEINHKRRITALGPGGLTRDRVVFDVRDVHITHYGRLCPIESPEGPNIGLINSLAIYCLPNLFGFLETPYRKVFNCKLTNEILYLSANEEKNFAIAPATANIDENNCLIDKFIQVRYNGEPTVIESDKINFIDISSYQMLSVAASLIPFLEHNDANRALMGSNMQRQAVPLLKSEKPIVGTGMEYVVGKDSGVCIIARRGGKVAFVDSLSIIINVNETELINNDPGIDIYKLIKYSRSNQNTLINQKPIVYVGNIVFRGDIIADGSAIDMGELALGQNMRIAFMCWYGYNYEDSIIISEKVLQDDRFTSIHIQELTCICRDNYIVKDIISIKVSNKKEHIFNKIDSSGIVYAGAQISPGDILVGKISPKIKKLTSEEKLLYAICDEEAYSIKDTSLRAPAGTYGVVIDVNILIREYTEKEKRSILIDDKKSHLIYNSLIDTLYNYENIIINKIKEKLLHIIKNISLKLSTGDILDAEYINSQPIKNLLNLRLQDKNINNFIKKNKLYIINRYHETFNIYNNLIKNTFKMNDLAPGILKIIKVTLAIKRTIKTGDKMAGRHGNKGVVSVINPIEDMPFDSEGIPIDIILNPLGVPSRMNVGQILETHIGLAAYGLGRKIDNMIKDIRNKQISDIREFIKKIFNNKFIKYKELDSLSDHDLIEFAKRLTRGVPVSIPVFDSINEYEIKDFLKSVDLPETGKLILYDGYTGDKFDQPVTVGYMYMFKLNHLIDEKMHARSTGSYSLVTQQPLGGKALFGGQRLGEMEVWALEAYGAAHILQEMLTIKSDDINGRIAIYNNIINNDHTMIPNIPESFNVLINEIRALCLNIDLKTR